MRTRWDGPKDFCEYGLRDRHRYTSSTPRLGALHRRLNVAVGDRWWG